MAASHSTPDVALPIECARVRLRRFDERDLEAFVAYRATESIYRYQTWPRPYTREHAQALIAEMRDGATLRFGAWLQVAIAERETDALIGDIGTLTSATSPWVYELGFTIAPSHQRSGYASEAVCEWLIALREQGHAHACVAVTDARNLASKALLERLGFALHHREVVSYFGESCIDEHFELRARPEPTS